MTTAAAKTWCCACKKQISIVSCGGCSQNFCGNDFNLHRETLEKQLDEIENDHDMFRQTIIDQKEDSERHSLIQQVDQWEEDSINQIKQTADECRQRLIKYTNQSIIEIENELNNLAKQLKETREGNNFNEVHLKQLETELTKLNEELKKPANISIEEEYTSFISKISVILPLKKDIPPLIKVSMTTPTAKTWCCACKKQISIVSCGGCSQNFCGKDFNLHRETLEKQLNEHGNDHNALWQTIINQKENFSASQNMSLLSQKYSVMVYFF